MTRFGSGSMDPDWHSGTGILGNPTIIARRSTVGKCMFCMYVPGWWSGTIWTAPRPRDLFVKKVSHVVHFFFLIVWISRDKLRNNDGRQGRKQDRLGAGILRGWENGRIVKKKIAVLCFVGRKQLTVAEKKKNLPHIKALLVFLPR